MLRPSDLVIDAFVGFLRSSHASTFSDADPAHARAVERAARMALPRIATTDALYHDLDHALCLVQVGQDLLRGRIVRDGDVTSLEWAHLVSALLCFGVGFCNGAVRGDSDRARVVDADGTVVTLATGATDGSLWPWFVDRSKLFVLERFQKDPVLDAGRLVELIEAGRFPSASHATPDAAAGLVLDAHLVGSLANPRFVNKLTPFFVEMTESGMVDQLGFDTRSAFQAGYADYFWKRFHPHMKRGMELLTFTGAGREWLATLRAHVLRNEHAVGPRSL